MIAPANHRSALCVLLAQEFNYLREKYDFHKAEKTCDKLGPEWRLPYEITDELIDLYKTHSLEAVWAGIIRKELPYWQWINGTKGNNNNNRFPC